MANAKIVTPKGTARYPRVNTPDTKFDPNGAYSVGLILTAEEAAPLITKIDSIRDAYYQEQLKEQKKAKLKLSDPPYRNEEADDGSETGRVIFKFKLKAKGKTKKGEMFERKPAIFDAKGKPTKVDVWGGSQIKVAFEPRPFFVPAVGLGVSLQLAAVQVIELVTKGNGTAEGYGFSQEDGFEAATEVESTEMEKTDEPPKVDTPAKTGDF